MLNVPPPLQLGWRSAKGREAEAEFHAGTRQIVVLVYPDICALDAVGPLEAFAMANDLAHASGANQALYALDVAAATLDPIPTSVGFMMTPTRRIDQLDGPLDTVLVSGGDGRVAASRDERFKAMLRQTSGRARRYGSICTGAFALAAAGLLDGRHATTHWARAAELQRLYPKVKVDADCIFTRDENVYTSAGISAGVDLALALIEEDHGSSLALRVAQSLVVPFRRAGGQAQLSTRLDAQFTFRPAIQRVQAWAADNPAADLSVEAMARQAGMSPRNFARAFKLATGETPAEFVARVRMDETRKLLEQTSLPLKTVATRCGFSSSDSLRRFFMDRTGMTPVTYRRRVRSG